MRCVLEGAMPVDPRAERVVALPAGLALASDDEQVVPSASVTLGSSRATLYLRFEPVWESRPVQAAFLLLDPAEHSVGGPDVELEVWRARREWSGAAFSFRQQPGVTAPLARGIARSIPPLPVRVDVTELVQFAAQHPRQDHGFAVRSRSDGPLVTIATGSDGGRAPTLDVYLGSSSEAR